MQNTAKNVTNDTSLVRTFSIINIFSLLLVMADKNFLEILVLFKNRLPLIGFYKYNFLIDNTRLL